MTDAIAYVRKHLTPWVETHLREIQQAMALMAFPSNTQCAPYKVGSRLLLLGIVLARYLPNTSFSSYTRNSSIPPDGMLLLISFVLTTSPSVRSPRSHFSVSLCKRGSQPSRPRNVVVPSIAISTVPSALPIHLVFSQNACRSRTTSTPPSFAESVAPL